MMLTSEETRGHLYARKNLLTGSVYRLTDDAVLANALRALVAAAAAAPPG